MFKIFKIYKKQIWAIILALMFILANELLPAKKNKSGDFQESNYEEKNQDFNLSSAKKIYSETNALNVSSGDFFRFIFKEQSNQDTTIYVKLSNSLGEEQIIGELELKKSKEENTREIIFQADRNYSDIIFEKIYNDDSNIQVGSFRFTKLNINNQEDIKSISPTIFGKFDDKRLLQSQDQSETSFDQLMDPKTILGQVFQSDTDFISDIEVDIDVVKQNEENNNDIYQFIVKKATFEGNFPEIKNDELVNLSFSIDEIEKYRQSNGKFKFPVYIKVQKGEYYFWGINNDKSNPNRFNYLKIRGTRNSEIYQNGTVAIKKSGDSFSFIGDLYFLIYGVELKQYEGKKILLGSTVEDLGNYKIFKYQTSQRWYDLADLDSFSGTVFFNEKKKSIAGIKKRSSDNQEMIYKFEPPSSFKKFKVYAQQANINWNQVDISYSFDKENWNEIKSQFSFLNEQQIFDQEILSESFQSKLYLRIKPLKADSSNFKDKYGVANLVVEIDLSK